MGSQSSNQPKGPPSLEGDALEGREDTWVAGAQAQREGPASVPDSTCPILNS